jgi:hypothetical protein
MRVAEKYTGTIPSDSVGSRPPAEKRAPAEKGVHGPVGDA